MNTATATTAKTASNSSKAPPQPGNYAPQPGSLAARVLAVFGRAQREAFTNAELAIKFDTKPAAMLDALRPAVLHDLLEYSQSEDDDFKTWRAGPAFAEWQRHHARLGRAWAATVGTAVSTPSGSGRSKRASTGQPRTRLPDLDFSRAASTVREAAPPPTKYDGRGNIGSKYDPLFNMLPKPGMSVDVPLAYFATLTAAVTKRNRSRVDGRWLLRRTAVDVATLWREA